MIRHPGLGSLGQSILRLGIARFGKRLHLDQSGSISIATVFSFILLTMVLGMLMNIGRHTDRKIKIQNAADAATLSGSTFIARSMNTLAFTNHLLCDVFALTAYLREARDRNSEAMTPEILDHWNRMSGEFTDAPHRKFSDLAQGIPRKTPLEADLIEAFSDQNAAVSENLLPVMEQILEYEMIPEFQRALVLATPSLATQAANEIAARHGPVGRGLYAEEAMSARMWQTSGSAFEPIRPSGLSQMPVADPIHDFTNYQPNYFRTGVRERQEMANWYLRILNNKMLKDFDQLAKMSQFSNLWRGFTRAQLKHLLEVEYPDRNIPYQIRQFDWSDQRVIEADYMFVGVAYWKPMQERMPGLFNNPMQGDQLAFAQAQLYIPRARLVQDIRLPPEEQIFRFPVPQHRDLMNQNWTTQLVPATAAAIPTILQTAPGNTSITPPNLGGLSVEEFRRLNTH